jgi:ubiquinone/menaquinone biosynthesis C-methylase UbiE
MSELQFQSRAAEGYDTAVGRITVRVIPSLLREAQLEPGLSVLDIAGGTGLAAAQSLKLIGPSGHVTCADISPAMLEAAKARLIAPNVTVAVQDGQNLSYPDNCFDRVICNMGLMYFPDPLRGLSEFRRVTRPGGRVTVSNNRSPESSAFARVVLNIAKHVPSRANASNAGFRADESDLRRMFHKVGFHDVRAVTETLKFTFANFEDYFGGVEMGHGNAGQEFTSLPPAVRERVRSDILAECGGGGPFSLDVEITVASGRK